MLIFALSYDYVRILNGLLIVRM